MNQTTLEHLLHPQHLSKEIKEYLSVEYADDISNIKTVLQDYLDKDYWDSKNERLAIIKTFDLETVILDVLVSLVLIADDYMPLISVCSAKQIKGMDKVQSATTMGEILHCIDSTDLILWDITKDNKRIIKSNMALSDELENRLKLLCVLPPMMTKPRKLTHNKSSGFLTIKSDSLILGDKENHHDECISLDVLNTLNSQALALDLDICYKFEKEFTSDFEVDTDEYKNQKKTYDKAKEQFEFFRDKLTDSAIFFTHKVDKRGRVYSQGYTFSTQGTSYEKACINLKTKEYVTGEL
ncbi:hypothetical protein [Moraxella bovis]|uniref:Uncharacterized protein n=1 Tax=Moraxella bovis TaxID=476 RepID=A0ABY6M5Z5_MORBO|nr:hypothetical protein [Moraxella bovis]UZA02932.1 hypothetical protein LP092_13505 [Moraxella bovis]UZA54025.1 hypothetical protein LP111_12720 [Moraxella bovis]UZA57369.1 hypothetical protein LP127_01455 [Moraxella bovis]